MVGCIQTHTFCNGQFDEIRPFGTALSRVVNDRSGKAVGLGWWKSLSHKVRPRELAAESLYFPQLWSSDGQTGSNSYLLLTGFSTH
jgi:hypothetical protein